MSKSELRVAASKEALKSVYYVLIGIAVAEALNRVFLENGQFLGLSVLTAPYVARLLLLFAFLPTITRFVHGASIHLGVVGTHRLKPLYDFIGFFLQAILFYIMALSIDNVIRFTGAFVLLLAADVLWILILRLVATQSWVSPKGSGSLVIHC